MQVMLGGKALVEVYCGADGRTLVASTTTVNSPIRQLDPRQGDLGIAHPDQDYMMAMSK